MTNINIHVGARTFLSADSIIFLEAKVNYTVLYLNNGKTLMVATTLKKLQERFQSINSFFRTHKSSIINLNHVLKYDHKEKIIELSNHRKIVLAKRRTMEFHERFQWTSTA
jgi:DNA-binding LytR/AlgR family response regulator